MDFVSTFVSSGHLNTSKIIEPYRQGGTYTIQLHEFLRTIVYGDRKYYDPRGSPVANLFTISQPDGREHCLFSQLSLLGLLIQHIQLSGERGGSHGYVPTDQVYDFAQKAGFSPDQIAWSISRGIRTGLLERAPVSPRAPTTSTFG